MGIECCYDGCNNAVIGQCRGYKIDCGNFYCRAHSLGRLCHECACVKKLEEKLVDYIVAAENVADRAGVTVYVFACICMLLTVGAIAGSINHSPTVLHALLICGVPAACTALIALGISYKNKYAEASLTSAERGRPGFREFYKEYCDFRERERHERAMAEQRETLRGLFSAVTGGLVVGAVKTTSEMAERIAEDAPPRVADEELRRIRKTMGR